MELKNNGNVVVKKMNRTTKSRIEKKMEVYSYLVELVNDNKKLPNLTNISMRLGFSISTMQNVLKQLDKENKVIYRKGKILMVNIPSVKSTTGKETKYVKQEEKATKTVNTVKRSCSKEKYDLAVKKVISEYIINSNVTTRDDIVSYIDAIVSITDKVKNKLFEEE